MLVPVLDDLALEMHNALFNGRQRVWNHLAVAEGNSEDGKKAIAKAEELLEGLLLAEAAKTSQDDLQSGSGQQYQLPVTSSLKQDQAKGKGKEITVRLSLSKVPIWYRADQKHSSGKSHFEWSISR